jgi:hypothetical protein
MPGDPIVLTEAEFAAAVDQLHAVGYVTERDAAAAWQHFRGWRVNYESLAYRWANRVFAPPAPWSGTRSGLREQNVAPRRPPHRTPDAPDPPAKFRRPDIRP